MGAWRKLSQGDIDKMVDQCEYGVACRWTSMSDTPYNGVTIMGSEMQGSERALWIARPMAYASKGTNNRQPMIYTEVLSILAKSACEMLDVYEGFYGVSEFRT
jgi:hypothetical protein